MPNAKPTFMLTDRLPAVLAPQLLGRFVADPMHPTHEYVPEDPRPLLTHIPIEIVDEDALTILSSLENSSIGAKLGSILKLKTEDSHDNSRKISTRKVLTRSLPQQRKCFIAVLDGHRDEILKLLQDNKGKGYMIVGMKTYVDAELEVGHGHEMHRSLGAKIPVAEVVAVATQIPATPLIPNPSIAADKGSKSTYQARSAASGEEIFAIQYRVVKLKKSYLSSTAMATYGDLKRVDFEDGVYGPDAKGRELVFEDEDSDEASDDDDDAVEILNILKDDFPDAVFIDFN
jgi:hypothetical protein